MTIFAFISWVLAVITLFYVVMLIRAAMLLKRYRNIANDLDIDVIAVSPLQPLITTVIHGDLRRAEALDNLRLTATPKYLNYESILICDSQLQEEAFDELIGYYRFSRRTASPRIGGDVPVRSLWTSRDEVYEHLAVVDLEPVETKTARQLARNLCRPGYLLFLPTVTIRLEPEALVELASGIMESPVAPATITGPVEYVSEFAREGREERRDYEPFWIKMNNLFQGRNYFLYRQGGITVTQQKKENPAEKKQAGNKKKKKPLHLFTPRTVIYDHIPNTVGAYVRRLGMTDGLNWEFCIVDWVLALIFLGAVAGAVWVDPGYGRLAFSAYLMVVLRNAWLNLVRQSLHRADDTSLFIGYALVSLVEPLFYFLLLPVALLCRLFNLPPCRVM